MNKCAGLVACTFNQGAAQKSEPKLQKCTKPQQCDLGSLGDFAGRVRDLLGHGQGPFVGVVARDTGCFDAVRVGGADNKR